MVNSCLFRKQRTQLESGHAYWVIWRTARPLISDQCELVDKNLCLIRDVRSLHRLPNFFWSDFFREAVVKSVVCRFRLNNLSWDQSWRVESVDCHPGSQWYGTTCNAFTVLLPLPILWSNIVSMHAGIITQIIKLWNYRQLELVWFVCQKHLQEFCFTTTVCGWESWWGLSYLSLHSRLLLVGRDTCTVIATTGEDNALSFAPSLRLPQPTAWEFLR